MSTTGEVLRHPINGAPEQTWEGFSWPAFFFGIFWLLIKKLYGHFIINLLILLLTFGLAAPIVWIIYGAVGNSEHKRSLLRKGYLTNAQWEGKLASAARATPAPANGERDTAAQLRDLAALRADGVLTAEEFDKQKVKLLAS